jgi:Protein of unknown function (DUF4235)
MKQTAASTKTGLRQNAKVTVVQMGATWLVRTTFEVGYRRATGRPLPTARDRDTPFRQVLVWATVTAAAIAASNVIVDQRVLRPKGHFDDSKNPHPAPER